jgi:hypothetical protein
MISYPDLGKLGRLGNHLFQIAATIGVALDNGDEWGFPRWVHENRFPMAGRFHDSIPGGPVYKETRFAYDPIPYRPDLRLHGYFQSERYFGRHAETVRRHLTPHGVPPRDSFRGIASVQVRRGDYLSFPQHHPVLPMDYYTEAIARLRAEGTRRFLVFSDDLGWCRANFCGEGVEVIGPMDPLDQFATTIACDHHIMANSTFSWWSAWLDPSPHKRVIAPRRWFGPGYAHYQTSDLYPAGWSVI